MPVGMIDHRLELSVLQPAGHLRLWWRYSRPQRRNSKSMYHVTDRLSRLRDADVRSYARGLPGMAWGTSE